MNGFLEILDEFEKFDFESQSVLVDIINKRFNQHKHEIFINETNFSIEEIKQGNFHSGSSEDLFKELDI